jgi:hypothetical protein
MLSRCWAILFFGKKGKKMKWKSMNQEEWKDVAAFVDTLILPIHSVELRDKQVGIENSRLIEWIAESLEQKLTGRVLLLPAISYIGQNHDVFKMYLNEIIKEINHSGFYYLVLITNRDRAFLADWLGEYSPQGFFKAIHHAVDLGGEGTEDHWDWEEEALYQKVLEMWQNRS